MPPDEELDDFETMVVESSRASTAAVIASRLSIIAPSSDSSASRLCGGIRPAGAAGRGGPTRLSGGRRLVSSSDWTNADPLAL